MKFTVEIEDFYLDEDDDLMPSLKSHIVREVTNQISSEVKTRVDHHMNGYLKEMVGDQLKIKTQILVDQFLAEGKIKDYYSSESKTTKDWIAENVSKQNTDVVAYIKKQVELLGKQLKERYDLTFASHIVAKLNEQGMLKENIAALVLGENKP